MPTVTQLETLKDALQIAKDKISEAKDEAQEAVDQLQAACNRVDSWHELTCILIDQQAFSPLPGATTIEHFADAEADLDVANNASQDLDTKISQSFTKLGIAETARQAVI